MNELLDNSKINEKSLNNSSNINILNESEKEVLNLSHLESEKNYIFDYEINNIKLDSYSDSKIFIFNKERNNYDVLNYKYFNDELKQTPFSKDAHKKNYYKASFLKHLVSKQKIRFQNSQFDLDLAYITNRVIAMGFPSNNFYETFYRNSLSDIKDFFNTVHKGKVKIYNLCLEKERIYNKNIFNNDFKVSLFPSLDHNPCSVKLILEFCIDIVLFLTNNIESVAAVHCKAGKGRTGVMICSYLIFSNLCENSEDAIKYYAIMRTLNEKGVTIPSQIRYIKYFETFLNANYYKPFYFLIPKIIKEHLFINNKIPVVKNLLFNLENDSRYYTCPDFFKINFIKIGPFDCEKNVNVEIQNFTGKIFDLKCFQKLFKKDENVFDKFNLFFYFVNNNDDDNFPIHSDIKIIIKKDINFYICLNLWFDSLNKINSFLLENENNKQRKKSIYDILKFEKNSNENFNKIKNNFDNNNNNNNNNKLKNGFLIFDENDFEITKNSFNKEIESFFQEKNKSFSSILNYVHHYDELNNIINTINMNRKKQNKKLFNKNNISIQFGIKQFDKFKEKKEKKYKNIFIEINYSIK